MEYEKIKSVGICVARACKPIYLFTPFLEMEDEPKLSGHVAMKRYIIFDKWIAVSKLS